VSAITQASIETARTVPAATGLPKRITAGARVKRTPDHCGLVAARERQDPPATMVQRMSRGQPSRASRRHTPNASPAAQVSQE